VEGKRDNRNKPWKKIMGRQHDRFYFQNVVGVKNQNLDPTIGI